LKDRRKDRNDLKTRKKMEAAGNEMIMEVERRSIRLHSVESLLWKRPYMLFDKLHNEQRDIVVKLTYED
jgi:hypothetical protein